MQPHSQDQVFGVRCDTFKVQWTGSSIACPSYQAEHAAKAVTWAIQSAMQTNVPTLTLMVLPTYNRDTSSTAHMRWIKKYPEHCKILATLPRSLVKLQIPPNTRQPPACTLKWNMQLVAVGNQAGFQKYLPYWSTSTEGSTWRHAFRDAIQAALEQEMDPTSTQNQARVQLHDESADWWLSPPGVPGNSQASRPDAHILPCQGAFRRRPTDTKHRPRSEGIIQLLRYCTSAAGALPRALKAAKATLQRSLPTPPPLRHDWREFIYTDGSVLANSKNTLPGIGAGIYIPANARLHRPEQTIPISCSQESDNQQPECVNTINRAELAAIDVALQHALQSTEPEVHIATDSLASIYQVQRAINRPQDMKKHRHLNVITQITSAIRTCRSRAPMEGAQPHWYSRQRDRRRDSSSRVQRASTRSTAGDLQHTEQ